ncbi:related to enoyl-[acyl-carrier-protein] reductase 1 [Cephalotrichum gorgonifer]|uniref:Related to enoyl-[acyl-carrier-protein] reductase 1 n=1 Tax=Cephalotrichum gorgonifer TaxID=2041049 RepID=A0AAE8N870_9PEZI|nr:related to enoyl-[acyl-carrier-protein] reductase 1 [Cephalotrichum gorgonifer]
MTSKAYDYNKIAGRHVLIIGGTSGLGLAVAKATLFASGIVTISSSSPSRVSSTVQALTAEFPDAQVAGYACDLSTDAVEAEIEALFAKLGRKVDHIVYTAGDPLAIAPLQEITREKIVAAGQLRFVAPLLVAKVGSRYLEGGVESSITLTTASTWELPIPDWSIVAGYAAGVGGITRGLALDLKPIRINAVSPGMVDTERWDALPPEQREGLYAHYASKYLTGRVTGPGDVAEAYIYLMKDYNITGRVIGTDSGALIM